MADRPQQGINANDGSTVNADSVVNNFAPQEMSQTNRDGGDNVAGDKVEGNKYVSNVPQPGAERTGGLNNLGARGISPDRFVGRDAVLEKLHGQLMAREVVAIAGITGMGGVGKTELAVQYGRSREAEFTGGVVWLTGARLVSELVGLARQFFLKAADLEYLGRLQSEAEQVQFCWSRWPKANPETVSPLNKGGLRGDPQQPMPPTKTDPKAGDGMDPPSVPPDRRGEDWVLVIVDDVVDFAAQVKPFVPSDRRFKVLVTTRDRHLLPEDNCLFLDVLALPDALELLARLIGEDRLGRERQVAVDLVERLGRLPLAIELVGAFLKQRREWSLEKMRDRLTEKGLGLRALTKVPGNSQAERGVAAAFAVSWEVLTDQEQRLAVLLGCFGTGAIPWGVVQRCLPEEDEDDLEEWREEGLVRLSLLTPVEEGCYGVHPLVREFFRGQRSHRDDGEALQQAFLNTLVAVAKTVPAIPTLTDQARTRSALPHLEQAAHCTDQITTDNGDYIWPITALARLAESQSLWPQAEHHYQAALQASETRLGADHPDTATSLNNLALLYESQGRYGEAEPLYKRSLKISEEQLGADHPHTASSLNNLAVLYFHQQRWSETEEKFHQALAILSKVLGDEHPHTQSAFNSLTYLINHLIQTQQTEHLSDHSLTQALLQKLQSQPPEP